MKRIILAILLVLISQSLMAACAFKYQVTGIQDEAVLANANSAVEAALSSCNITNSSTFSATAITNIKAAVQAYGYFQPTVRVSQLIVKKQPTFLFATALGPATHITDLQLKLIGPGATDPNFQAALQKTAAFKNQPFTVPLYNTIQSDLYNVAYQRGYLNSSFIKKELIINPRLHTAKIYLSFNTGKRYKFGQITFTETPLSPAFLARYLTFHTGDYYDSKKVAELQQALSGSKYFKSVSINSKLKNPKVTEVPITIELKPQKKYQYNAGVGFGTDTGVRASLGVVNRYITQNGENYNLQLQLSQIQNSFQANYNIPGPNPAKDHYTLSASMFQQEYYIGNDIGEKVAATYTTQFEQWQQIIGINLQNDHSQINGDPVINTLLLYPSIAWDKLITDDPIKPIKGYHINLTLLASPGLPSRIPFAQALFNFKYITPIFTENRLLLRTTLGYTAINNENQLPLSLQFFAGGAQSVRGYGFNSLGPSNKIMVGSVEYRQHIKGNFFLAGFVDATNIKDNEGNSPQIGVGPGLVWVSPIGTVELTVAKALGLPNQPNLVQFSIGSDLS